MKDTITTINKTMIHCSITSQAVSEPLFGTAPRTDYWILMEYNQPLGAKALQESTLPQISKEYLLRCLNELPNSRLLLIKKQSAQPDGSVQLFLGRSVEQDPTLLQFTLDSYEDILSVPIVSLLTSPVEEANNIEFPPMYLVCTNGKRDLCCARWGMPVLNSFQHAEDTNVWQTSHVGGHRFAPNVISLPYGIYYGRVTPESVNEIITSGQNQEINLLHLRGRACLPAPAQAAEYYLRQENGQLRLNSWVMNAITKGEEDSWKVIFRSQDSGDLNTVIVSEYTAKYQIFESCAKPTEMVYPRHFHLVSIQQGEKYKKRGVKPCKQ